jgi:hypothetical protein
VRFLLQEHCTQRNRGLSTRLEKAPVLLSRLPPRDGVMVVFLRIPELNDMRGARGSHGPLKVAYRPIAFNFFSTRHKMIG